MVKDDALAYLAMDIDCKINYKAKHNKSMKGVFGLDNPVPEKIKTKEALSILGVSSTTFKKYIKLGLVQQGVFCNGDKRQRFHESQQIRLIQKEQNFSFESKDLLPVFSSFYVNRTIFYKMFGELMTDKFDVDHSRRNTSRGRKVIRVVDVAKAFQILRHRKDVIENWKTMKDVWEAADKPVAFGTFKNNISSRFSDGSINFEQVSIGTNGKVGLTYKIDPKDFPRLVEEEKERYKQAEGVTMKEIAERFGYGYMSIRNKVAIARERQLIKLEKSRGRAFVISEDYLPNLFKIFASRFKSRDQRTISVLMDLHESVFHEAATIYVQGMEHEEKVGLAQMSFFEMVKEEDFRVFEEGNVKAIQEHMKKQIKAERPTWLSLDKPMGEDGQRWGDLIADESYEEQYCEW